MVTTMPGKGARRAVSKAQQQYAAMCSHGKINCTMPHDVAAELAHTKRTGLPARKGKRGR